METIRQGDIKTFEKLFRDNYNMLCNYAVKIVNNTMAAEEIVQDVFYNFWKNRLQINIQTPVKAYLFKAVYNKSLNYLNHVKIVDKHRNQNYIDIQTQINPEEQLQAAEFYNIYTNTLESLPKNCQIIFSLSREQGLKYSEIAEKLKISVKTVEANMTRALKLFKQNFAAYQQ